MAYTPKYTVRPFSKPARQDFKDAFRMYMSPGSLHVHNLDAGVPCRLRTAEGITRTALAWPAPEKIGDAIVQVSKVLQTAYDLKLGDKITISRQGSQLDSADTVLLSDISQEVTSAGPTGSPAEDDSHWEWFLEHVLEKAGFVTLGMVLEDMDLRGLRRSFRVEGIDASTTVDDTKLFRFHAASKVKIEIRENIHKSQQPLEITKDNIGGLDRQITRLNERLTAFNNNPLSLRMPHFYRQRGGVLLHGPTGTGKSLILKRLAAASWQRVLRIDSSVIGRYVGDSEAAVRKVFAEAYQYQPSLIILDQLDVIAGKPNRSDGLPMNIASVIGAALDQLEGAKVLVVAATQRPNDIEESLRTPGRLSSEIEIPIPDANARIEILKILQGIPRSMQDALSERIGECTHGFVGADLDALLQLAAEKARSRYLACGLANGLQNLHINGDGQPPPAEARRFSTFINGEGHQFNAEGRRNSKFMHRMSVQLEAIRVSQEDFDEALLEVRPTAMREVFLEAPKVRWSDIGGQEEVKQSLREVVEWPFKAAERMERIGIEKKKGLLLYGPPGCSKTLTAKALATEAGLNFIAVKGAELLSMYVGESERALREVFRKARAASPSIIFFDEIDAIGTSKESGHTSGLNVLTTLLNEMDGIELLKGVLVLAATNKPEVLDPALMRPGRLDTILYVGPPDLEARIEIFNIRTRKMDIGSDVDIVDLAHRTDRYSGAEIVSICEKAGYAAFGECERDGTEVQICRRHFDFALSRIERQITDEVRQWYEQWSVGGARRL